MKTHSNFQNSKLSSKVKKTIYTNCKNDMFDVLPQMFNRIYVYSTTHISRTCQRVRLASISRHCWNVLQLHHLSGKKEYYPIDIHSKEAVKSSAWATYAKLYQYYHHGIFLLWWLHDIWTLKWLAKKSDCRSKQTWQNSNGVLHQPSNCH